MKVDYFTRIPLVDVDVLKAFISSDSIRDNAALHSEWNESFLGGNKS